MANCKNCSKGLVCACSFDSSETANQTGNGRSYAPINWRPINVPFPRPYGQYVRFTSNQSIGASSDVALLFNELLIPYAGGMVDPATSVGTPKSRLTVPVGGDGVFIITGVVSVSQVGYVLSVRKNGATYLARQSSGASATGGSIITVDTVAPLVGGDYVELVVTSTATPGATEGSDANTTWSTAPAFWAQWMRGL